MRYILPLCIAVFCLHAMGACTASFHPSGIEKSAQKEAIETRGQLLLAVNAWLKEHRQPEWTMDELVGRMVDESFAYKSFGPRLDPPVDSFVVSLIKNRRFNHQVELHTDWTDGLQLSSSHRLSLPAHHTLSIRLLATPAERRDRERKPENGNHWSILVASALSEVQPNKVAVTREHGVDNARVETSRQLLSAINAARHEQQQPELTRDEVCIRLVDATLAHYHFEKDLPEYVEIFLERFIRDRRFANPINLQRYWTDGIELADLGKFTAPAHDSLYIDIPNMPWGSLDPRGQHLYVSTTQLIVSFYFRPQSSHQKR